MSETIDHRILNPTLNSFLITNDTRISEDYSFTSSTGLVEINDLLFKRCIAIINIETNEVIYNIGDPSLSGSTYKNEVVVDFNTSSMNDLDTLYILYEAEINNSVEMLLIKLINETKKTNKILNKIYQ